MCIYTISHLYYLFYEMISFLNNRNNNNSHNPNSFRIALKKIERNIFLIINIIHCWNTKVIVKASDVNREIIKITWELEQTTMLKLM